MSSRSVLGVNVKTGRRPFTLMKEKKRRREYFTMLVSNTLTIGDLFTMLVFPYKGDLFTMLVFLSIVTGGLLFEHSKLDGTKKKTRRRRRKNSRKPHKQKSSLFPAARSNFLH